VEGLPEALRASAMIVDGAYKIDRAQGANTIVVTLRCRRNNVTTLETTVAGSVTNLAGLQQSVVSVVASNIGVKAECGSMDPAAEVDMLADEASALLGKDNKHAAQLAEAAAALLPDESRYKTLLIKAYAGWLGSTPDEFLTYGLRGLSVLEQLVRRDGKCPHDMPNFLGCLFGNLFWPFGRNYRAEMALPEYRERFRDLCDTFWRVSEECHLAIKGKDWNDWVKRASLLQRTSEAYRLSPNLAHAIEHSRRTQKEFIEFFKLYNTGPVESSLAGLVDAYVDPAPATWPLEKDAGTRLADYLEELCRSDDVVERMVAERAAISFYGATDRNNYKAIDYTKARKHAENYVKAVSVAREMYPSLFEFYLRALGGDTKFYEDQQENEQFQRRMLAMLDPPPAPAPPRHAVEFPSQQVASLDAALKEAPLTGWKPTDIHFRRLVVDDGLLAIAYTHGMLYGERAGLLRLDPLTFRALSFVSTSAELPFNPRMGNESDEYGRSGPAVAVMGSDVFLGFPTAGIVQFRADGTAAAFNEEKGLASDDIMALDVLDGKLYAAVGRMYGDTGLMELDPRSGVSTILFSSRSKFPKGPLDNQELCGIAADPVRHQLWVLTPRSLFVYDPAKKMAVEKIRFAAHFPEAPPEFHSLQRKDEKLLVGGWGWCFEIDIPANHGRLLAAGRPANTLHAFWKLNGEITRRLTPLGANLAFMDRSTSLGSARLLLNGRPNSENLVEFCFPEDVSDKFRVRDIASSPQGLLVLTDYSLYLVPGLHDQPHAEAGQQPSAH